MKMFLGCLATSVATMAFLWVFWDNPLAQLALCTVSILCIVVTVIIED